MAAKAESYPLESRKSQYFFSAVDDFNHPLTITDCIVCWSLEEYTIGDTIEDTFGYQATVAEEIVAKGTKIGYRLNDIRQKAGGKEREHDIIALS